MSRNEVAVAFTTSGAALDELVFFELVSTARATDHSRPDVPVLQAVSPGPLRWLYQRG